MLKRYITTVTKDFVSKIDKQILIDVRTIEEVSLGKIPKAKHLPIDNLKTALLLPPAEFEQVFRFKKPSKRDELVFYCLKGSRSTLACNIAKELGYEKIYNYQGSWADWTSK